MATEGETKTPDDASAPARPRRRLRAIAFHSILILFNLMLFEAFLRVADFRDLRVTPEEIRLPYDHDREIGWFPVPGKVTATGIRINSIGLRDIELAPSAGKPTIMFVGDSFVYGAGVQTDERFTEKLRAQLPDARIVNAGVAAYGTDQELLMLRRLWPKIEPNVVVLIVCVDNDHDDNSTNSRHGHTLKPYLANVGGKWEFQGQPVPRSHTWYYYNNWFANHSAIVRLAIEAYKYLRYPAIDVPDPTNQLVAMMRDFAEARGARFLVGLQKADPDLEPFLTAQKIPYVRFEGAPIIPGDNHWNPEGHTMVAERLKAFLADNNALGATDKR